MILVEHLIVIIRRNCRLKGLHFIRIITLSHKQDLVPVNSANSRMKENRLALLHFYLSRISQWRSLSFYSNVWWFISSSALFPSSSERVLPG